MTFSPPSLVFVLVFLLFSAIFFFNSYKLWFKTDAYYQDIYDSLSRSPSMYPFADFFRKRMENKRGWVLQQKIFSAIGLIAVLGADILVVMAYLK